MLEGWKSAGGAVREAVGRYFGGVEYSAEDGKGGMNNTTVKITVLGCPYMLRVYDTHRDLEKAEFEHKVLLELNKKKMAFQVPEPVESLEGGTVIRLKDSGKLAAMFRYIEGQAPDFSIPSEARAFGEAAAELMSAMEEAGEQVIRVMEPVYPPYYMLGSAHPRCPLPEVARFCSSPPDELGNERHNLRLLSEEIRRIGGELEELRQLPHRLIHGDLNASNALARPDGTIAAILDFEFATVDLRAMEPAVCLWSIIPKQESDADGPDRGWESVEAFWRGFASRVALHPGEIEAIPLLIQLRSLDVFVHFLGRYMDGVDECNVLAGQIPDTAFRMLWVAQRRKQLLNLLQSL